MDTNLLYAFILTLGAGLATGIGGFLGLFAKKTNLRFLSLALGFSAGVMLYISFVEIYPKANELIAQNSNNTQAGWLTALAFFTGIILIALIDKFIPENKNPHHLQQPNLHNKPQQKLPLQKRQLLRMGLFTALAVTIHNFPEGLATFMAALTDPTLGLPIAIAIALHNIPEGIAVAVPIFHATGNKVTAFKYSLFSGLAEPLGAIIGFLLLRPLLNDFTIGLIFAAVAGIMVYISLDELLPAAKEYGHHHLSIYGLIAGMAIMALSLLIT